MNMMYLKRFIRRLKYCCIWSKLDQRIQKQSCTRCGRFIWLDFHIKDTKWNHITSEDNCLCIDCLIEIANNKNIKIDKDDITLLLIMQENMGSEILNDS